MISQLSKERATEHGTTRPSPRLPRPPTKRRATPFEAFSINVPNVEVPAAFREFAEKSIDQARDAYTKMKSAAEDATDMVEGTYETARDGAFAFGVKAHRRRQDQQRRLVRVRQGPLRRQDLRRGDRAADRPIARKQFDAVTGQMKEFQELAQKIVTDTTKPVTTQVQKTFKDLKAA